MASPTPSLLLFSHPYRQLRGLGPDDVLPGAEEERRGAALIWRLTTPPPARELTVARHRPPGVPLIVVLPPSESITHPEPILRVTELCRPHSILPHHHGPRATDLRAVLSRPPDDLPGEVVDYLTWRGIHIDLETRRLIRKTLELSGELTTVSGLARALYLSRRALGRRFTTRGLPVPSHWLHFGRVLRVSIRLQDSRETLFTAATALGYPDGFALSNQMMRLLGHRPTVVRERLGWEWILEAWLSREAAEGGFSREVASRLLRRESDQPAAESTSPVADPPSLHGQHRRPNAPVRVRSLRSSRDSSGDP